MTRPSLDPIIGPPIPFRAGGQSLLAGRKGKPGILLGNAPSRLAVEIVEADDGHVGFREIDPWTMETVSISEVAP
jgi:hypothetical protein